MLDINIYFSIYYLSIIFLEMVVEDFSIYKVCTVFYSGNSIRTNVLMIHGMSRSVKIDI